MKPPTTSARVAWMLLVSVPACDRLASDPETSPASASAAPSTARAEAPAPKAEVAKPVAPAVKPAPAPAPAVEPAPVQPAPVQPAPAPCRIVRARYQRTTPDAPFAIDTATEVEAAATLDAWTPDAPTAPPVLTAAALATAAQPRDGVFVVESPAVEFALDVADRQALATVTAADGSITQYIYLYDCAEIAVDALPGADEGQVPEPHWAAAEVPVHTTPGAPSSSTRKARKGAAIRYAESRVLVRTPAVATRRDSIGVRWSVYDPAAPDAPPTEARLEVPVGRVVYLYAERPEGGCLIGDGARIFEGDCSSLSDFGEPVASMGPLPTQSTWWLRLGDDAWIEAVADHVRVEWISQGGD